MHAHHRRGGGIVCAPTRIVTIMIGRRESWGAVGSSIWRESWRARSRSSGSAAGGHRRGRSAAGARWGGGDGIPPVRTAVCGGRSMIPSRTTVGDSAAEREFSRGGRLLPIRLRFFGRRRVGTRGRGSRPGRGFRHREVPIHSELFVACDMLILVGLSRHLISARLRMYATHENLIMIGKKIIDKNFAHNSTKWEIWTGLDTSLVPHSLDRIVPRSSYL